MSADPELIGTAAGDGLGAMKELIRDVISPALHLSGSQEDSTRITLGRDDIVVTTDLYTVDPIEFPGGDIGRLAACGGVNDLAASGAVISGVTVGLLLSPSLPRATLTRVLRSMYDVLSGEAADVWCGDTKVVNVLSGGLMMSVTAVGSRIGSRDLELSETGVDDVLVVTGPLGAHSIAVLSAREGLGFERAVMSDVAPLGTPMRVLVERDLVHAARDLTRGGLIGALWDGVEATGLCWEIHDDAIPVDTAVRAASELLGCDVHALTNEGCMLLTVGPDNVSSVMEILRANPSTRQASVIGVVRAPRGTRAIPTRVRPDGTTAVVPQPYELGIPHLC